MVFSIDVIRVKCRWKKYGGSSKKYGFTVKYLVLSLVWVSLLLQ
jgi:hypothetical protein